VGIHHSHLPKVSLRVGTDKLGYDFLGGEAFLQQLQTPRTITRILKTLGCDRSHICFGERNDHADS